MTSDRPPKKLAGIEDRLRSRFEWGLIADIKPAGFETRVAILKKKAQNEHINVDEKLLLHIAGKLKSNIRELEGLLKRLSVYATMEGKIINMELVSDLIGEWLPEEEGEPQAPDVVKSPEKAPEISVVSNAAIAPEVQAKSSVTPSPVAKNDVSAFKRETSPESPAPAAADKSAYKSVSIAYFYPEGNEKDFESMKKQFREVISKNKFKFQLEAVFERSFDAEKKINPLMFAELCKTNKVDIAIMLAPASYSAGDGSVFDLMPEAFEASDVFAEIIPHGDLMKQYRYLNILLDITLLIH